MTTGSACLNPIRPSIEELVSDNAQVQEFGKEEPKGIDCDELICGGCNADVGDDASRPKPASRPYTPTKEDVRPRSHKSAIQELVQALRFRQGSVVASPKA